MAIDYQTQTTPNKSLVSIRVTKILTRAEDVVDDEKVSLSSIWVTVQNLFVVSHIV